MATAEDIEHFIAEQKSKLARDRHQLDRRDALPPQVPNRAQNGYPPRSQEPTYSRKGDPPSPRPIPRGSYERVRSRLNEERRQEYNKALEESGIKMDVERAVTMNQYHNERKLDSQRLAMEENSIPGLKERDSAKLRMRQQRNQEYNDFLRQKEEASRRRRGLRGGQSEPDVSARAVHTAVGTNPIVHDVQEHKAIRDDHKIDYRKPTKDEYSQTHPPEPAYDRGFPPPAPRERDLTFGERPVPPRQGWKTPIDNYDDVLRRKREEEARYRHDDPYYARQGGMRPAYSDPHLSKSYDEDERLAGRKMDYLDQEYDTRKVRFRDEAIRGGMVSSRDLERPRYRDPPRDRDPYYGESRMGRRSSMSESDRLRGDVVRPGARSAPIDDNATGLLLGGGSTASAQQRKKEQYRKELEQQMAEAKEAKRREKESELAVNASGAVDPEKHRDRLRNLPPQEGKALPTTMPQAQVQRPSYLDERPPNLGLSKAYARSQPSTYLEQPLDIGAYPTSQLNPNDPYVYYGLRDPLDPETAKTSALPLWLQSNTAPPGLGANPSTVAAPMQQLTLQQQQQLQAQQQLLQQTGQSVQGNQPGVVGVGGGPAFGVPQMGYPQGVMPGGVPMAPAGVPGVGGSIYQPRGPEFSKQDTAALRGDSSILNYIGDEALSPRNKKIDSRSYQQELLDQMKENDQKKKKAKMEEDEYNRKLEAQIQSYNPWGKGGGGAPMKDIKGNVVADLKQLHILNEDPSSKQLYSDYKAPTPRPSDNTGASQQQQQQSTQQPSLSLAAAFADDSKPSHARGKIFNDDPEELAQQKTAQDSYKEFLQRQVEEKKRKEAEERDKIRQEEERENRRIEEERLKMQREFEFEQDKQRKKEEEARQRNEELAKEAENKRKEQDRLRREADDQRSDDLRRREEEERRRRDAENTRRVASPPIPALRPKAQIPTDTDNDPDDRPIQPAKDRRSVSPPLPATRSRIGDNQDVIHALSAMRRQLRDEQSRIQQQLQNKQYDEYDQPDRHRRRTPQVDVFEMARNKEAVYPRRASAEPADPNNLSDFNNLKNRGGRSRQEFRRQYPDHPNNNSALEAQQNALIQQQEDKLNAIRRGRSSTERDMPGMNPKDIGLGRESPSMPLPSESAFVNANTGETEIPSPLGYKPSSARQRRRALDSPPTTKQADPMGSVTSFDVDSLAKRNKERLQKLKHLEADGDSLADPDEVLKRFMTKSSHDRPPSATSQDAWLRPSMVDA
ncbi:centrosome and spindle pole-associated protein 1-like isoform X4 [Glandiceps talaboti]